MVLRDVRYGLRLLTRRPSFGVVAALTLALGIGTNTTIFAVFDRVMLRATPFPDADELVVVWETNPRLPVPVMYASPPTLHDWMTRNRSFESMGAFRWRNATLGGGEPEQVRAATVNASLLTTLGVQPALGRLFLAEEDRPGAPPVALLSDALWQRRFNREAGVLDRTLIVDGVPHQIVGVMPPGYAVPPPVVMRGHPPADRTELWLPLAIDLAGGQRGAHNLTVIARLDEGVTLEAADADVRRIARDVGVENPDYSQWNALVVALDAWVTASSANSMRLLAAAVGFVLLLACANVANLLLARGVGRRREFAVRAALGAGRARLAAQVIGESMALALVGGVAGVLVALGLTRLVVALGPETIPGLRQVAMDARAFGFAAVITVVAAVLAGLAPALGMARARVNAWLTDRSGLASGGLGVQRLLVVGQVALAMALLVTASLLIESFRHLRGVDPGFRQDQVITGKVVLPAARYPDSAARSQFVERLLAALETLPGVQAVGVADAVPLADNRQGTSFARADAPASDPTAVNAVNFLYASEGFFDALGIPLRRGRTFEPRDARVLVVNERLAAQVFGDADPVGQRVTIGISSQTPFEVVGVVGDDRHAGVDADPTPTFFVPYRAFAVAREVAVIARAAGEAEAAAGAIRGVVRQLDPEMPFYQVRSMEQIVERSMATPRSLAWLLSGFALSGLLLAAIGVFGVLSHAVGQRSQEIGVRMAMGARPGQMLAMILRDGMRQVAFGLVLGLGLAAAASQLLSGLLFGVTSASPGPYLFVSGLVLAAAAMACLAPALRAMRIDPATVMRES